MRGYSYQIKENYENYAAARVEGVNASYKDLAEVCGRIRELPAERAVFLLEKFETGELPVLYKSHNTKLGHRREVGGQKGRYPKKAAGIVLKVLRSALANAQSKGLVEPYILVHASANKKNIYPRMSSKGRRNRSNYETSRVEIILREKEIVKKIAPKKVEVQAPTQNVRSTVPSPQVESKVEKQLEKPIEKAEKPIENAEEKVERKKSAQTVRSTLPTTVRSTGPSTKKNAKEVKA